MPRKTVTFRGRVQGVFFRATTERVARDFRIDGWVRNEPDGSVRCEVKGDAAEIQRFLDAVQNAKAENIESVEIRSSDSEEELEGFTIRR